MCPCGTFLQYFVQYAVIVCLVSGWVLSHAATQFLGPRRKLRDWGWRLELPHLLGMQNGGPQAMHQVRKQQKHTATVRYFLSLFTHFIIIGLAIQCRIFTCWNIRGMEKIAWVLYLVFFGHLTFICWFMLDLCTCMNWTIVFA